MLLAGSEGIAAHRINAAGSVIDTNLKLEVFSKLFIRVFDRCVCEVVKRKYFLF